MKRKVIILIGCFFAAQSLFAQADVILNRYKQFLLATLKVTDNADQVAASLDSNGRWTDIDYDDRERANWQPLIHMKRLRSLAFAYSSPKSQYYHKPELLRSISMALQHWVQKKYKCPNWWHNEIGVPQQIRDIIVLLQNDLLPGQLKAALELLAQYRVNENSTGANLTWSADLGLHYGLLTSNEQLAQNCRERIINEIKITTGDGVQPDYSFHQHGKRLQMYQYGAAFLQENVRIAWELSNTTLAFPKEKINLLGDFLFKGWQWMTRGLNTVPGTMDRSASRKNALQSSDVRYLVPYLAELLPEKKKELDTIVDHQNGKKALEGFTYFPYSDFACYQQKDFSFFIKTISNRTLATESINGENLKGHLLNSGDTYFIYDDREYFNLLPVWNWEYLPGVTSFSGAEKVNRTSFSGSVSDGKNGFTSMDYCLEATDGKLSVTAKKSWFCYDGKMICLIGGLKGKGVDSAYTTLDQCRWTGTVTINTKDQQLSKGDHFFKDLKWLHHGNFVYVPLESANARIFVNDVAGNWATINASESDELVKDNIFMPVVMHDNLLAAKSFAYMVAFCKDPSYAGGIAKRPGCTIIRNDSVCQAISFTDGTIMAAFFEPASIVVKETMLKTGQPCLVMIKNGNMFVSDPQQVFKNIKVGVNKKSYNVLIPANGFSTPGILIKHQ